MSVPLSRAVLLGVVLLLAMPTMSKADNWILVSGKGSVAPDKAFADQVTRELDSRGLDWGPWTALEAVNNPDSVPTAGKNFVSPDQNFSVQTIIEDSQFYFVIKDAQTGLINRLDSNNFPVLALAWSPDSKSLLAVVHAPMSSFMKVIHRDGNTWNQFEIDAPEEGDNDLYHVVGWQFKNGYLEASYILDHRAASGASLYRCTFHINPTSGNVSHVIKTVISQEEFISLRNGGN